MPLVRHVPVIAALLTIVILVSWSFTDKTIQAGDIRIKNGWARASIGTSRPAAAFFTIVNTGTEPDRLVTITSPIAGKAEVHETTMKKGVMRMSPTGPLKIRPGKMLVLKPGGLHVMLMNLRSPLVKGDAVKLRLTFERAGLVEPAFAILGPGASGP